MRNLNLRRKRRARAEAHAEVAAVPATRRSILSRLGLAALLTGLTGQAYAFFRALVPNVLYEPPQRFKVGLPDRFPEGPRFLEDRRLFIFREQKTFHAVSAVCTHLGCTVKLVTLNQPRQVQISGRTVEVQREFHCPCHGYMYYGDGTNYAGPAPRPLDSFQLSISPEDGQLVVDLAVKVDREFRLTV